MRLFEKIGASKTEATNDTPCVTSPTARKIAVVSDDEEDSDDEDETVGSKDQTTAASEQPALSQDMTELVASLKKIYVVD